LQKIFLEIAFLKSAKIAEGPGCTERQHEALPIWLLAVRQLFATTATEGLTLRRIVP